MRVGKASLKVDAIHGEGKIGWNAECNKEELLETKQRKCSLGFIMNLGPRRLFFPIQVGGWQTQGSQSHRPYPCTDGPSKSKAILFRFSIHMVNDQ